VSASATASTAASSTAPRSARSPSSPADRVAFAGDEPGVFACSAKGRRYFCRRCGSPVFYREEGSDEIELFTGAFDEIGRFAPTYEAWVPRREPWLPEIPGVSRRYDHNRTGPQRTEP
jgi:hypothetical protein